MVLSVIDDEDDDRLPLHTRHEADTDGRICLREETTSSAACSRAHAAHHAVSSSPPTPVLWIFPTCGSRTRESGRIARMTGAIPTLYVCHGDEGGPRIHPCRRVQEALHAEGIPYDKEIAAHGSPIPFLRKGSREELLLATGTKALPTMRLPDGAVLAHSKAILAWIADQESAPVGPELGTKLE